MWQISILCCRIMQALIVNHGFFWKNTPSAICSLDKCPPPIALWTNALRQLPSGQMPSANCPLDKCPPDKCSPPIALWTNALRQLPSEGFCLEGICLESICFWRAFFGGHLSRGHFLESFWLWRAFVWRATGGGHLAEGICLGEQVELHHCSYPK